VVERSKGCIFGRPPVAPLLIERFTVRLIFSFLTAAAVCGLSPTASAVNQTAPCDGKVVGEYCYYQKPAGAWAEGACEEGEGLDLECVEAEDEADLPAYEGYDYNGECGGGGCTFAPARSPSPWAFAALTAAAAVALARRRRRGQSA
jgi:hypothetical protein